MEIKKITPEQRELMKKKSAQSLPDVPSSKGWTPKNFKDSITKPLFDNENSFYSHINELIDELNDVLQKLDNGKANKEEVQEKLISGVNIATINGNNLLDGGDIKIKNDFEDYNKLKNKPSINTVVLEGDKSLQDIGVFEIDKLELDAILD